MECSGLEEVMLAGALKAPSLASWPAPGVTWASLKTVGQWLMG